MLRSTDMEQNFKNINNISEVELPGHLRQAVFARIEKEKTKQIAGKLLLLRIGSIISGISSIATVAIFGKGILASEFCSILVLGFSDLKTVMFLWQDYAYSLLETMPIASIAATLLPIFVFMILLRQYGKLEQFDKSYSFKH